MAQGLTGPRLVAIQGNKGGSNSKCAWSGTCRWTLVRQPAQSAQPTRSSTRTICLVGLAPTAQAHAANSTSNSGMANADGEVADDATWQSKGGMDEADQIAREEAMLPRTGRALASGE